MKVKQGPNSQKISLPKRKYDSVSFILLILLGRGRSYGDWLFIRNILGGVFPKGYLSLKYQLSFCSGYFYLGHILRYWVT
jgi:hypothetical protein